jgi:ankyrin repeat protein
MTKALFSVLVAVFISLATSTAHSRDRHEEIHKAIEKNNIEGVRTLLDAKTNPNLRKDTRASPTFLTQAARLGREEIVSLLLQHGVDVDGEDGDAMTPLMWASWNGHLKVVNLLIKAGSDVNARDKRGDSVLSYAILGKSADVIARLKAAGAK